MWLRLSRRGEAATLLVDRERGCGAGEFAQRAIARRSDDLMSGSCALFAHQQVHRRAAIGYALASAHWGRGYATEGARAVVRMAYEDLGATHLISLIRPGNKASIRIAEKLGAVRESTIEMSGGPAHIFAYGGPPPDPTLLLPPPA